MKNQSRQILLMPALLCLTTIMRVTDIRNIVTFIRLVAFRIIHSYT